MTEAPAGTAGETGLTIKNSSLVGVGTGDTESVAGGRVDTTG
jgi:hypothetical protein